jgi:DNA modification methylase
MILDTIHTGHALEVLRTLPDESVHCCVTSPPYWGLRDYGLEPQIWDASQPDCLHDWGEEYVWPPAPDRCSAGKDAFGNGVFVSTLPRGAQAAKSARGSALSTGQFCQLCGAWMGSFGLEPTYDLYIDHTVQIFLEVRRVLRNDGTLWLNLGDSYNNRFPQLYLKPKDMVGIPWRVAFALQAQGWYLRQDIIWQKPTCMPESVKDRCTKDHEYVFILAKSERYYFDQDAIKEPASPDTQPRYARGRSDRHKNADGGPGNQTIAASFSHMVRTPGVNRKVVVGWASGPGSHSTLEHAQSKKDESSSGQGIKDSTKFGRGAGWRTKQNPSFSAAVKDVVEFRNKRSVWSVVSEPFSEAHFATFPQKLILPMILAGTPPMA